MSALRDALQDLSDGVFFDLLESDEAYLLVVDVPGVTADRLEVAVDGGRIEIEARREKSADEGDYRYVEENRPLFHEIDLPLPEDAAGTEAEAVVERGVLELTLPKREAAPGTTIDVVDRERTDGSDREEGADVGDHEAGADVVDREGETDPGGREEP